MNARILISRAASATLCLALVVPALRAGTPLICHPYEIGNWKTLPGGPNRGTNPSYDRAHVTPDTLALLSPQMPLIARMETLRRAALYATVDLRIARREKYSTDDVAIARGLLDRLQERVGQAKDDPARGLALFDAGFFAETVRHAQLDLGVDGYALMVEARQLRPDDAEIEFALALASSWPKERASHPAHLASARAHAKPGTLLASNLNTHFGRELK